MKLLQLQYFQTLAKMLHYTKAAEALHISQPSLSYAIAELEKELKVPLFIRAKKKISLSPYGECFLEYVNQALDMLDKGVDYIHSMKNANAGTVTIGYIYSLSTTLIPEVIDAFKREQSNTDIKFKYVQDLQTGLVDALKDEKVDLIISADTDPDLISVPLFTQELYLMVHKSHPLAKRDSVSFSEIAHEPFIMLDSSSALRKLLDKRFQRIRVKPNIVAEANECAAALQYVAQNDGVTIVPDIHLTSLMPVKRIKIASSGFVRTIYISWKSEITLIPPVHRVRDYIISYLHGTNSF
ncbi:MAG: LysR family transcriptional regulator [Acidaminococcus sp.]|jgi:DNA-binding transcriptional LysR family regulator|nr:LysR family transcriptional regulator [Acidaminococcus sp.]MCI2100699.1 LysR family transcriptional regulator [Acidaminococcus sp.]MCI2115020.1 LysR family transcriptional regulator [Acidaminococcus sp.]MCI2117036.1 LysR family transcriptional regulator [Acidaminococcus sp.]